MKQTQKGNTALIAIIVVIVAITAGVIGWILSKNSQTPLQQNVVTQSTTPVAQTQPTNIPALTTQPQANDETASWQTFTNTKLGFIVKYPNGYVAKNGDETKSFDPSKVVGFVKTLKLVKGERKFLKIISEKLLKIYLFRSQVI